jgi:hypothetical protein
MTSKVDNFTLVTSTTRLPLLQERRVRQVALAAKCADRKLLAVLIDTFHDIETWMELFAMRMTFVPTASSVDHEECMPAIIASTDARPEVGGKRQSVGRNDVVCAFRDRSAQ